MVASNQQTEHIVNSPAGRLEVSTARVSPSSCVTPSAPRVVRPKKIFAIPLLLVFLGAKSPEIYVLK